MYSMVIVLTTFKLLIIYSRLLQNMIVLYTKLYLFIYFFENHTKLYLEYYFRILYIHNMEVVQTKKLINNNIFFFLLNSTHDKFPAPPLLTSLKKKKIPKPPLILFPLIFHSFKICSSQMTRERLIQVDVSWCGWVRAHQTRGNQSRDQSHHLK